MSGVFPVDELRRHSEKRVAIAGTLMLTTGIGGKSVSTPAVLLVRWPDAFRLEVQDPVGGVLALLIVRDESFWLYQREARENLSGPLRALPRGMLPALSGTELLRTLLARPDWGKLAGGRTGDGMVEKGSEKLSWARGNYGPSEWIREREALRSSAVQGRVSAEYSDYSFRDGAHFPTKIRLRGPDPEGREAELLFVWKDWEPRLPLSEKPFQFPQDAAFGRKTKTLR